jgi:hypothetical protein
MGPYLAQETSAGASSISPEAILWFGGVGLFILALIQLVRILKGGMFSASFRKLYGILFVAILGSALAFADVPEGAREAAYTLFGTAAGYLAGARQGAAKES